MLLFWIPLELLSFNVFEHKLWLRKANIIWENFWISVIKSYHFWQSWNWFILFIKSLQKLTHVIKNQVIFKNWYNVSLLIIDYVIDNLRVVVLFWSQIFLLKVISNHLWSTCKCSSYFIYSFNRDNFWTILWIIKLIYFCSHIDTELAIVFWFVAQKNFWIWPHNR